MEKHNGGKKYRLPDEKEIERASMEAARRAIDYVAAAERRRRLRSSILPTLKVAACVAIVLSISDLYYRRTRTTTLKWASITTKIGERKRILLPDSSIAELNAGSTITFPESFKNGRNLRISGEAFFRVKPDASNPFVVQAGNLDIVVLGTSFNVRAYQHETRARVAVSTGKVSVENRNHAKAQKEVLTPGEQISFDPITQTFSKSTVDPDAVSDWQRMVFSFEFQELGNICDELGRAYGVTFRIADRDLARKRFQLRVENESLENILKLLSISGGGFSYRIKDGQVNIQ